MKMQHTSLLLCLSFFFATNTLFAQLPYDYLSDIYNLEWCRNNKIKTIQAGQDKYVFENNIIRSENPEDLKIGNDGRRIEYTEGNGLMKIVYLLSDDLKRLKKKSIGLHTTHFNYDKNNRLTHKIFTTDSQFGNSSVQEFIRDSEGRIIKILKFNFINEISNNNENLIALQEMGRVLSDTLKFSYDKRGNLILVDIDRNPDVYQSDLFFQIKPFYTNDLPKVFEITEFDGETVKSKKQRKFKYTVL